MSLITETGNGLPNAESYLSVAEADAYHLKYANAAWDEADPSDKEIYLRRATDYLTQNYRQNWKGMRSKLTQALDWPRANVPIPDAGYNFYVRWDVIPIEVKTATALLALKAITTVFTPDIERTIAQEKIGPIEITYDPAGAPFTRFREIDMILCPLLLSTGATTMQVVRT